MSKYAEYYKNKQENPKKSQNQYLERLIGDTPFIQREKYLALPKNTYEVSDINPIYQSILPKVTKNLGQILTPFQYEKLENKSKLKTMATGGENGRLIEARLNQQIRPTKTPNTLTLKGVGGTSYARDFGNIGPYIPKTGFEFSLKERQVLSKISFYQHRGILNYQRGIREFQNALEFKFHGVPNIVQPVGIFILKELLNENNQYESIESLKARNIIEPDSEPCILARISYTNFRLMDFDVLHDLQQDEAIQKILTSTYLQYCILHDKDPQSFGIANYIYDLTASIISTESQIGFLGYEVESSHWQDIARNYSLLGERFDTGDLIYLEEYFDPNNPIQPSSYLDRTVSDIFQAAASFHDIFSKHIKNFSSQEFARSILLSTIKTIGSGADLISSKPGFEYYVENSFRNNGLLFLFMRRNFSRIVNLASTTTPSLEPQIAQEFLDILKSHTTLDSDQLEYVSRRTGIRNISLDRETIT